ncbi:MAG: hypothetical protein EXS68_02010 [Candidatus Ryanbacteria bacterium]|nr:hypothetical protein [Candidatus Ryanbacteria bacterium]
MQSILSFESSKDHYTADVCIVWCFDARFSHLLDTFIKDRNYTQIDLVKIAGGAKEIDFVIDQIGKSIKLHHTPRVVLMVHNECGAYGGSTDPAFYEAELSKAADKVRASFPSVEVEAIFADFDGLKLV